MRYWWVNQNQTFKHEVAGGFLWSPKTRSDGGRNEWYVMSNASKQADGSFKGDIYQTTGVPFAQINGQAARQGLATVGSGTFRFSANNTATFNYKIGAVDQTKNIVRQQYKVTPTVCTQQPPLISRAASQTYQDL